MKRQSSPILFFLVPALSISLLIFASFSQCQELAGSVLELLTPLPGAVAVGKRPRISFRSSLPLASDELVVLLDGNDVTGMFETTSDGIYRFSPFEPLAAGQHSLYIVAFAEDGTPVEQEFLFTSRHSASFEEISSDNRLSVAWKTTLHRDVSQNAEPLAASSSVDYPYTSFDSYLKTGSSVREGHWKSSARVNLRYYEQNAPLSGNVDGNGAEKKGLGLIDFLVNAQYTDDRIAGRLEVGDTTINVSSNTVDHLTRRGGQASLTAGDLTLTGFGVLGKETGYDIEGLGLGFNSNDHLIGATARFDMFDRHMSLTAIFSRGGERGNALGSWSESGGRKGDVTGILWTTDFFNRLVMTDIEFDSVNFDAETEGDEDGTVADKAYRIRIHGLTEVSDYELSYRYAGPQYEVVGNRSVVKDWAGFDASGGTRLGDHRLRLLFDYSWDNVEKIGLYGRIYSLASGVEYRYEGWQLVPFNLLFEHNRQRSSDEPPDTTGTELDTSTLTGSTGYNDGRWAVDVRSSYSEQDDKTANNFDTTLFTVSVTPSYTGSFFSIQPSWSLNSSFDQNTGVRTNTHTVTLDLYSGFFDDSLTCELGGTHDWTETDDDSIDSNNTALYGRVNYRFTPWHYLEDTTLALEYRYDRQEDRILNTVQREGTVFLVLSTAIPYLL